MWFVIKTNPRCERRAEDGLRAAGFQVYMPMASRLIRRRNQKARQRVYQPLLTGYLFVGLDEGTPGFYDLRLVDGVHSVLGRQQSDERGAANRYIPVGDHIVAEFRRLQGEGKFDELDYTARPFSRNDQVEIVDGPLRGMVFSFDDYFGKASARIVGALTMRIPLANLRKAA